MAIEISSFGTFLTNDCRWDSYRLFFIKHLNFSIAISSPFLNSGVIMQQQELDTDEISHNDDIKSRSSFALSEVGSLYFGPNPSPEARRLLEQAKELIRENERIEAAKKAILEQETELRNRKVFLGSDSSSPDEFQPNAELCRMLSDTTALSNEGKRIDRRKAQLELYYKELKRRKEFLQTAIKMFEESELSLGTSLISDRLRVSSIDNDLLIETTETNN